MVNVTDIPSSKMYAKPVGVVVAERFMMSLRRVQLPDLHASSIWHSGGLLVRSVKYGNF